MTVTMNTASSNQPTDEKYKELLQGSVYRFSINLERLYMDYKCSDHALEHYKGSDHSLEHEYLVLATHFLVELGDYEAIEDVYQRQLDNIRFFKLSEESRDFHWAVRQQQHTLQPIYGIKSPKYIYKYLRERHPNIVYSYYECEHINDEIIPLKCFALNQDFTVDYFNEEQRDFFDEFFYFKLIMVHPMDIPLFLDYHLHFSFNHNLKLYSGFLNSFVKLYTGLNCPHFLDLDIANDIIFWLNNHNTHLNILPIPKKSLKGADNRFGQTTEYNFSKSHRAELKDILKHKFSNPYRFMDFVDGIKWDDDKPLEFTGTAAELIRTFKALDVCGILSADIKKFLLSNFKTPNGLSEETVIKGLKNFAMVPEHLSNSLVVFINNHRPGYILTSAENAMREKAKK